MNADYSIPNAATAGGIPAYDVSVWAPIDIRIDAEHGPAPRWTGTTGYSRPWPPRYDGTGTWGMIPADGYMALDIDHRDGKTGRDTIDLLESQLGILPPTIKITSRGGDEPGGKFIYRVPPDWAGRDLEYVELIQRHHRHIAMGTHWRTHTPVRLYDDATGDELELSEVTAGRIPDLPQAWLDHLGRAPGGGATGNFDGDPEDGIRALATADPDGAMHADYARLEWKQGENNSHAIAKCKLLLSLAKGGRPGAITAWKTYLLNGTDDANAAHTMKRALADPPAGAEPDEGIYAQARERIEREAAMPEIVNSQGSPAGGSGDNTSLSPAGVFPAYLGDCSTETASLLLLPDKFWESSAALRHVRDYAYHRYAPADAVLFSGLAILAASLPWQMRVDTGILMPASLNTLVALCDWSGGGKTSAKGIAARMLRVAGADSLKSWPFGSGEGIPEAYMGTELREAIGPNGKVLKNKDGSPKFKAVRCQTEHGALFFADEGRAFTEMMSRAGSTLGEMVRTAWSGETIGQANGRADTTRLVSDYAFGAILGFQPGSIGPLIAENELGTVQRFLFAGATDPNIPDEAPADPGTLFVQPPRFVQIVNSDQPGETAWAMPQDQMITVCAEIARYIREHHLARQRGTLTVIKGQEHRNLSQVKVAALLMILEGGGQSEIQVSHWEMAGVLLEVSDAVREHMRDEAARIDTREQAAIGERMGQRDAAKKATVSHYDQTVERVRVNLARGKTAKEIYQNLTPKQRQHFATLEAIAELAAS